MKNFAILFVLTFMSVKGFSQNGEIYGIVLDEDNSLPLISAAVIATNTNTGEMKSTISDSEGQFRMDEVLQSTYQVELSYVGYQGLIKKVEFNGLAIDLGILRLKSGIILDELQVEGEGFRCNRRETHPSITLLPIKPCPMPMRKT